MWKACYHVQLWRESNATRSDVSVRLDVQSKRRPSVCEVVREVMLMYGLERVEVASVSGVGGDAVGMQETVRRVTR